MTRRILVLITLSVLSGHAWAQKPPGPGPAGSTKVLFPDGFAVAAELALSPEEQEKGLMYRMELAEDRGMLFVFAQEGWLRFWMKNTWIDLDILFLDKERRITRVYSRVPRSYPGWTDEQVAKVPGYGQYVLELANGVARRHGLKAGARLSFLLPGEEAKSTPGKPSKK